MKKKSNNVEHDLLPSSKPFAAQMLKEDIKTMQAAAEAVEASARAAVTLFMKHTGTAPREAVTREVRFRLSCGYEPEYLTVFLPETSAPLPDAGLIRLNARDSYFLRTMLTGYAQARRNVMRMADLAGRAVRLPGVDYAYGQYVRRIPSDWYDYKPVEIKSCV